MRLCVVEHKIVTRIISFSDGGAPMETPDLSTLSDNIDSADDLLPSLQVDLSTTEIRNCNVHGYLYGCYHIIIVIDIILKMLITYSISYYYYYFSPIIIIPVERGLQQRHFGRHAHKF